MKKIRDGLKIFVLLAVTVLTGCATNQHYNAAFSNQTALTQNQCSLRQPCDAVFKIAKQTMIQQGFTIESADIKTGVIKAVRNLQDKDNSEISYNINASMDVSENVGGETNVSLAASQQTILHRSTTTWWHLLWIIPLIPTGTEYQTLVIREGNITEPVFYADFFNNLKVAVTKYDQAVKAAAAKAAAEKLEAERIAAEKAEAEARAAAEKAAKQKAEAEAKAAAERAELERIAFENALKAKAAAEKAAQEKAEAEAKAAAEKAEAERIAAEKARMEQDAADKAAAEKADKSKKKKRVVSR